MKDETTVLRFVNDLPGFCRRRRLRRSDALAEAHEVVVDVLARQRMLRVATIEGYRTRGGIQVRSFARLVRRHAVDLDLSWDDVQRLIGWDTYLPVHVEEVVDLGGDGRGQLLPADIKLEVHRRPVPTNARKRDECLTRGTSTVKRSTRLSEGDVWGRLAHLQFALGEREALTLVVRTVVARQYAAWDLCRLCRRQDPPRWRWLIREKNTKDCTVCRKREPRAWVRSRAVGCPVWTPPLSFGHAVTQALRDTPLAVYANPIQQAAAVQQRAALARNNASEVCFQAVTDKIWAAGKVVKSRAVTE